MAEAMSRKSKRNKNFTEYEKNYLVDTVLIYKDTMDNKETDYDNLMMAEGITTSLPVSQQLLLMQFMNNMTSNQSDCADLQLRLNEVTKMFWMEKQLSEQLEEQLRNYVPINKALVETQKHRNFEHKTMSRSLQEESTIPGSSNSEIKINVDNVRKDLENAKKHNQNIRKNLEHIKMEKDDIKSKIEELKSTLKPYESSVHNDEQHVKDEIENKQLKEDLENEKKLSRKLQNEVEENENNVKELLKRVETCYREATILKQKLKKKTIRVSELETSLNEETVRSKQIEEMAKEKLSKCEEDMKERSNSREHNDYSEKTCDERLEKLQEEVKICQAAVEENKTEYGSRELQFLLLNVNCSDNYGNTPLHRAAETCQPDIVKALLEHGASSAARTNSGWGNTPLHKAAYKGCVGALQLMINSSKELIDVGNKDRKTPLFLAAIGGQLEAVSFLLQNGANASATEEEELTPLHFAANIGDVEMAKMLLDSGADPNAKSLSEFTPLHTAAYDGQLGVVQLLVERGADPDAKNAKGRTPLLNAQHMDHSDVVEWLRNRTSSDV